MRHRHRPADPAAPIRRPQPPVRDPQLITIPAQPRRRRHQHHKRIRLLPQIPQHRRRRVMTNPRRQPQRPHPHRHLHPTPLPEPAQPGQHRPHHPHTHLHPTRKRIITLGRPHRGKPAPDKPILPSRQPPPIRPRPTHPRKPRSVPARTRSGPRGGGARETVLACVRAGSTRTLQVRFTDEPFGDGPVPAQRHRPIPTPIPRPGVQPAQPRPPAGRHLADHVVERPAALQRRWSAPPAGPHYR